MKYYILSSITRILLGKLRVYHKKEEQLLVYSRDFIGEEIYSFGVYEKDEIKTIIESLDFDLSKSNALDIGANIGNHAIQFSKYFNNVYCFEPNKTVFEVLKINTKRRENIQLFNIGLSNENKVSYLFVPENNYGGAKISSTKANNDMKIELKRFDDFFKKDFSFIKIDVEGHESEVFQGMKHSINKNKPIIGFELINRKENDLDLIKLLNDLGYHKFYAPYQPNFFFNKNLKSYFFTFLYGLFVKKQNRLVKIKIFDKKFYNLILCEHDESMYKIKRNKIK